MMKTFLFCWVILAGACMGKGDQQRVEVVVADPGQTGWYFVELKQDSLPAGGEVIKVKVDNILQLRQIRVRHYEETRFKVFNAAGAEISDRMKLPGILYNDDQRVFFRFYNPTDQELKEITNWLPTDPHYAEIINASRRQLKILLARN